MDGLDNVSGGVVVVVVGASFVSYKDSTATIVVIVGLTASKEPCEYGITGCWSTRSWHMVNVGP